MYTKKTEVMLYHCWSFVEQLFELLVRYVISVSLSSLIHFNPGVVKHIIKISQAFGHSHKFELIFTFFTFFVFGYRLWFLSHLKRNRINWNWNLCDSFRLISMRPFWDLSSLRMCGKLPNQFIFQNEYCKSCVRNKILFSGRNFIFTYPWTQNIRSMGPINDWLH